MQRGTKMDLTCAPPACLASCTTFPGGGGGPSLHTLSLGHLVKTVIQVLCSPLEGAATPRAHQSDALSEDSASSPVTRLSLMPST